MSGKDSKTKDNVWEKNVYEKEMKVQKGEVHLIKIQQEKKSLFQRSKEEERNINSEWNNNTII